MRIVLDSNVLLVSLPQRSMFRPIFDAICNGRITLLVSNEIMTEYEEVLCRYTTEVIATNVLEFLLVKPNVERIEPFYRWNLITGDADDNKFVDVAIAAHAKYIVTNDQHFNVLSNIQFPYIKHIKAEDFLQILKTTSF
ncbi:MAG: putative toxin-antitoxin system toxin component, PIN family [Prevotellaceae bacterium]|jgi:putative PIN family toxin of toxin-antitoxin system|nr:putative toxin-antitoxin system toxin component, PIN family [Prevotellaceae bacterium]